MGVLTDLIVAPHSDAKALAATPSNERTWPWVDVKGLGLDEIVSIHCLVDGVDADEPLDPPEWGINPFTKEKLARTIFSRYMRQLVCEAEAEDSDIAVFRAPPPLVAHLAALDAAGVAELAQRWEAEVPNPRRGPEGYAMVLESVCSMARAATERRHDLFVWSSP